tara:strand:- start:147 stop:293 length:147 start_codon:yes stop_codon:yes gene_type:complete
VLLLLLLLLLRVRGIVRPYPAPWPGRPLQLTAEQRHLILEGAVGLLET